MHPMAFAAWFGMLATALNLFPIGQLDGGHISYAVLGRRSTVVTLVTVPCLIGLTFVSTLVDRLDGADGRRCCSLFGPRHPRDDRRGHAARSEPAVARGVRAV